MGSKGSEESTSKSSQKHHRKRKRSRSNSSSDNDSNSSSSSSISSIDEETKRKLKKKLKKLKKKEKKKRKEKKALKKLKKDKSSEKSKKKEAAVRKDEKSCDVDVSLMEKSKALAPMTKEEWEKQQNVLTRVYDEETGRTRLIKGSGEIMEECVSRERHLAINKQATRGDEKDIVEEFFGVYLLKCLNPKYKGRTYIGYTIDPNRRIKQHNKGKQFGGAWRTSNRGPWEMVLTVHGFPSNVAALRFEWAWQHPQRSRRLKAFFTKKTPQCSLPYRLNVMFTMLTVAPWCRLPLTIRWLTENIVQAPINLNPPCHMPIVYGPVVSKKLKSPQKKKKETNVEVEDIGLKFCSICQNLVTEMDRLTCFNSDCQTHSHILCLAQKFLDEEVTNLNSFSTQTTKETVKNILPIEGSCQKCGVITLWGDLIRKKKGCYADMIIRSQHNSDED